MRSVSRASFYFGALWMLELVEALLSDAKSATAVELSLDAFRDEIMEAIEAGVAERH